MSMQPPPTSAERLASRHGRAASLGLQLVVLILGVAGAATIAGVLGHVTQTSNPIWVLPVIVSGFICFIGLLASTTWGMRSLISQSRRPVVSGGRYLLALLLTGGAVAYASDTPTLAYAIPLALAAAVIVLMLVGGARRRAFRSRDADIRGGAHVEGTVTDDGLAAFGHTPNQKLATITVTYRDLSGLHRWVQVIAAQSPARPIEVGHTVDVWFDHTAPDDVRRIRLAHDNGASRIVTGKPTTRRGAVDRQPHTEL